MRRRAVPANREIDGLSWRAVGPFVAAICLCALYCGLAASKTWPLIDGDGPAYFPAAVEWSHGRPLTNPVWLPPLNDDIDGPGGRRLTYHGFAYAIVTGTVGRALGGGVQPTVWAAYALHLLAAIVGALAVLAWADVRTRLQAVLAFVAPLAVFALSISMHGRPEPLALLVVGAVSWGWRRLPQTLAGAAAGAGAALLLFTSPACGPLALAALMTAIVAMRPANILPFLAACAGGWLATVVAAVLVYPFPIADWITGVRRHSRINLGLPLGQGFLPTWMLSPELPLLGLTVAVVGLCAVGVIADRLLRATMAARVFGAAAALVFAVGLTRIAFVKSEASYNAIVWLPLLACVALAQPRHRIGELGLVLALTLPVLGLARNAAILATQFARDAVTFEELRHHLATGRPAEIGVSPGLWMAVDDAARVSIAGRDPSGSRVFVQQQAKTGRGAPASLPGYRLLINRFAPPATLFGLPISRTRGGWEFALYERTP